MAVNLLFLPSLVQHFQWKIIIFRKGKTTQFEGLLHLFFLFLLLFYAREGKNENSQ